MNERTMRAALVPSADDHRLELRDVALPEPGHGQVRIKVEACGVCHSDSLTVLDIMPGIKYPRIPGHEIAGTIDKLGPETTPWKVGERVGVGWHGGHDGTCNSCRRGDFITCPNLQIPGIAYDGGYAQYVLAPAGALARIPDGLSLVEAAPLMCAGVTTFNPLRHSGAGPGDVVAVLGIGGLGHLGVQFAAKMGFNTVAIARGRDKEELARSLGAALYLDSRETDVAAELQRLGGARVVLSTVTAADAMEPAIGGLGVDGQLLIVGAAHEPLPVNTTALMRRRNSVRSWPSGTCMDSEDTMRFAVQTGIRSMNEVMPLERATEAYDRMMSGAARFRMVLSMSS